MNSRQEALLADLKDTLEAIEENDTDYDKRERLVYEALLWARAAGLEAGFRFDPNEPEWPVAYVELPTGQVSWHMPQHSKPYDGHTTEEKHERIHRWRSR